MVCQAIDSKWPTGISDMTSKINKGIAHPHYNVDNERFIKPFTADDCTIQIVCQHLIRKYFSVVNMDFEHC